MTLELLVELASNYRCTQTRVVNNMPELERVIAMPRSSSVLDNLELMMRAAECDIFTSIQTQQMDAILARFSWLVTVFREWNNAEDPNYHLLSAALAAAAIWDARGFLWRVLPPLLQNVPDLVTAFEHIVGSRQTEIHLPLDTPLWEREFFNKLIDEDQREDWAKLIDTASRFQLQIPDVAFSQAACALCAMAPTKLVAIVSALPRWFETSHLMMALHPEDACRIATMSGGARVQVSTLEYLAHRLERDLSPNEGDALATLLVSMAKDHATWSWFLQAFNRNPVRYLSIQRPLGLALSSASTVAVQAYIDAIELNCDEGCRAAVTVCLSEFRLHAAEDLRCALWCRAYERWDKWNFGIEDGKAVTALVHSVLDLAVIGWLVEGVPKEFVQSEMDTYKERRRMVEMEWHASMTNLKSALNRLISHYLIFACAHAVEAEEENWLSINEQGLTAALSDEFINARYGYS